MLKQWGIWCLVGLSCTVIQAQEVRPPKAYLTIPNPAPPGLAGNWAGLMGRGDGQYFQWARVQLPTTGQVTWYDAGGERSFQGADSQPAGLLVGPVYRLKISDLPEWPGVELFPTVELIDRLHPPANQARNYPVPLSLTEDEISMALAGRLVTKVIYLEQPNRATRTPAVRDNALPALQLSPGQDPIDAADQLGRPMAIIRLGARKPNPVQPEPGFFGSGAPVYWQAAIPARDK